MRGFIEKIPVLLTSTAPSIDSWFNARSGKYGLIRLQQDVLRPKIRTVDMRFSRKVRPYLSKAVFDAAKRCIRKEERVMFVINRRGHSTMLTCRECGATEKCADCGIPLVLHKDRNILHCHYCGRSLPVPEFCATCKSPDLELLGAGTQKIEADISELFGIGAVRFDSDRARRKSTIRELVEQASSDSSKIMVGTKMMTKRISASFAFSVAAVLNIDNSLNIPDFRAREKAYQDITDILDLAGPDGEVLIQTRFPQEPLFRHLRENTYESFAAEELSVRKALGFPPYSRLINVLASGSVNVPDKIRKSVRESAADIEILGPTETRTKKGTTEYSILLKHRDRKTLHAAARAVLNAFKNVKEVRIRIDVDPY
jgi:primosomal protein N' (replication factor Y)